MTSREGGHEMSGLKAVAVNMLGVVGKRGEDGRVITGFRQEDLARMRPGDEVAVRASGQGWRHPGVPPEVVVMNAAPGLLAVLPVSWPGHGPMTVGVRAILLSKQ